jgi:hypothetical protein
MVTRRLLVIGPDRSLSERRPEVAHVLLGLLQKRPQCFAHIGQPQLISLGEPPTIAVQLAFLQLEVGLQSTLARLIRAQGPDG